MKLGVVFFHKNINNIYKQRWIRLSIESMINQTIKDLNFYEINYGGDDSILGGYNVKKFKFYNQKFSNYAGAMNFVITKAFEDGCDYVFNTNLDDFYRLDRVEKELDLLKTENYDIISSDFCYIGEFIDEKGQPYDKILRHMDIWRPTKDIKLYLRNDHNIISHPSVCYSKNFWEKNRYDEDQTPKEDLELWKKTIEQGYKFVIHPEILLYYRIHQNQESKK
jgi:hypothetical protein